MGRPLNKKFFANTNYKVDGEGVGGEGVASVAIAAPIAASMNEGATVTFSAPQVPGGQTTTGTVVIDENGDIVSIDLGVILNGWHGDHAYSFIVGEVAPEILDLVKVTKESLYKGIEKATVNNRIGDISYAIQEHTEFKHGYGVVRELVGHGLGRNLHEDPQVPNYGKRGNGPKLKENLVLAIEPMINLGTHKVYTDDDGWTVKTQDGKVSVHFEHDICVKRNEALILSDFSIIETAEKANTNLNSSYY